MADAEGPRSDDPVSPAVAELAERLGRDPAGTALLLDFDGTLAPIVEDPAAAVALPGTSDLLDRLSGTLGVVAVVSGRPRAFLVGHLGDRVDLSGLYGLESRRAGVEADHPEAGPWRAVVAEVVADAARLPDGVVAEGKGLSLTVHHRRAPEAAPTVSAWAAEVAARTGLEVRGAKASVELHPPVAVDKGTAVRELAGGCPVVAYAGDDLGDLPAFAALAELRAAGRDAVAVAVASDELPEAVRDAADVVLDGPGEVRALLGALVARTGA